MTTDPDRLAPFGQRLRAAIKRSPRVKNRAALLHELRMEGATLYRYEKGERSPKVELVQRIADILGCSTSELLVDGAGVETEEPHRRAWRLFVDRGYVQFFQLRGATPEMFERLQRRRFKGEPSLNDLVAALEGMMDDSGLNVVPEPLLEARRRNAEAGRPDLSNMIKPPKKESDS